MNERKIMNLRNAKGRAGNVLLRIAELRLSSLLDFYLLTIQTMGEATASIVLPSVQKYIGEGVFFWYLYLLINVMYFDIFTQ